LRASIIEVAHKSRSDEAVIYPIGDVHVGASSFDESTFRRYVKEIADNPNAYWIGMGDYCDFITHKDPRYEPGVYAPWMLHPAALQDPGAAQRDRFLELVWPIRKQCLGLIQGNHEHSMAKHLTRDVFREIAAELEPHWPWRDSDDARLMLNIDDWLAVQFRRMKRGTKQSVGSARMKLWLFHGAGGGKLAGSRALNQQRYAWTHPAHVIITAHVHRPMIFPEWVEDIQANGDIRTRRIHTVISGTFKRRGSWERSKGFYPHGIGTPRIRVRPWLIRDGTEGFYVDDAIEVAI